MRRLSAREIAYTSMFSALVAVSTLILQIGISASHGYFNVGEIMVYASALLLGPLLGAAAGGIGSSISDAISGFGAFAPGTLVIKGTEAFLVAYIAGHKPKNLGSQAFRGFAVAGSLLAGALLSILGSVFYSGPQESSVFTSGLNFTLGGVSLQQSGPPAYFDGIITYGALAWLALGVIAFILILVTLLRLGAEKGWPAIAILIGGTEMVVGYLLYEIFVYPGGLGVIIEVPANIGQMVVGLLLGLPLARRVRSALPWLTRSPLK